MAAAMIIGGVQATSWANQPGPSSAPTVQTGPAGSRSAPNATSTQASPSSSSSIDDTYASREAEAKSLESFKGGDVVIIGSTGLVILLLVLLILVVA